MAFNKNYGTLGWFQLPLNIFSLIIVLMMFSLMVYNLSDKVFIWVSKIFSLGLEYFNGWQIPNIYHSLLNVNLILYFPIVVSLLACLLIYIFAYKRINEPWKFSLVILIYFTIYPVFRSAQWVHSVYEELSKTKKKW